MFTPISPQSMLRLMLLFLAMVILFYGRNGILPHQLAGSPLFDISLDNTFWLYHLSGIPAWLNGHAGVLITLEVIFIGLAVLLFRRYHPVTTAAFLLIMVLLSLYMQAYSCTLTKISVILPIVFLPWCFRGELLPYTRRFTRYYLVYLMASAALFKLINGGLFHPGQLQAILWNQHSDLVFYSSGHLSVYISEFLGSGRFISGLGYSLIFAAELAFIVLLFTRKYDVIFIGILVALCAFIYLVMRINTLEMLFLVFPLINISAGND
jgi:hypothetical protein